MTVAVLTCCLVFTCADDSLVPWNVSESEELHPPSVCLSSLPICWVSKAAVGPDIFSDRFEFDMFNLSFLKCALEPGIYKILVFTHHISAVLSFVSRAQTTASLRSGEQMTGGCWRLYAATPPRSQTWPSATRTPWSLPAPVTRLSECGAYRPAPLWPSWRDTQPPSPHCRYVGAQDVWLHIHVCLLVYGLHKKRNGNHFNIYNNTFHQTVWVSVCRVSVTLYFRNFIRTRQFKRLNMMHVWLI